MKRNHDILCYFKICAATTTVSVAQFLHSTDAFTMENNGREKFNKFIIKMILYVLFGIFTFIFPSVISSDLDNTGECIFTKFCYFYPQDILILILLR